MRHTAEKRVAVLAKKENPESDKLRFRILCLWFGNCMKYANNKRIKCLLWLKSRIAVLLKQQSYSSRDGEILLFAPCVGRRKLWNRPVFALVDERSTLRCPKNAAGLRFSLRFSTAAEIALCLHLPPAAAKRNSPGVFDSDSNLSTYPNQNHHPNGWWFWFGKGTPF